MRRLEVQVAITLACTVLAGAASHAADDAAAYRFTAPIVVEQSAPFVHLPLPSGVYGHSQRLGLEDLRIVDARGARVPFAVLPARAPEAQSVEQQRDALLYPLPPKPIGNVWVAPIEVKVQGEQITVIRRGGAPASNATVRQPGGWLIDLGARGRDDPPPLSLRLQWSRPAEFTTAFALETSDDLRAWRGGGHGQLMSLTASVGTLTQPVVVLPPNAGRFVRLVWIDPATAPTLTTAKVMAAQQRSKVLDAPSELVFAATPAPSGKSAPDAEAARAAHFDLGGVLPLVRLDLRLASGTRVVPAQVQARNHVDEPWRAVTVAVFYRLERGGEVSNSPPLELHTSARYVRIVPDARTAPLDATQTQLVVQALLASLVFATQGEPQFALQAGSKDAAASALPIATLVPALDDERGRFGRATLGPWTEVVAVARAEAAQKKIAALRPWLLWTVLVAGVAILSFMVWRLARANPANP